MSRRRAFRAPSLLMLLLLLLPLAVEGAEAMHGDHDHDQAAQAPLGAPLGAPLDDPLHGHRHTVATPEHEHRAVVTATTELRGPEFRAIVPGLAATPVVTAGDVARANALRTPAPPLIGTVSPTILRI